MTTAGLLLGVSLLSACSKSPEADSKQPPKAVEVGVVTLKPETVTLTRELPGRVTPMEIAEVRPQVDGIIQKRLFREGSQVTQGDPLYQIDSATYKAAADTAEAQLAKAEATRDAARSKAQRGQSLAARGLVSNDSQDDLITAQKQAEADVAVARAMLQTTRINLAYTQLKAPISGFIGKSEVTAGALVTAKQTRALAIIQQLDPVLVDISQESTASLGSEFKDAAPVTLTLPDSSAYAETGKLDFADLTVDASTGAISVRARFPNPQRKLLPGMFVRAKLDAGVRKDALLLPQQSATRKANGDISAWVVKADQTVEERTVQAAQAIGNKWLVESGLSAGEQVVVDGLQKIKQGAKVKPVAVEKGSK
ncbi:efflux RND transporter periplasmic adaptor subunit [Thiothrix lacustris]|uniref:efflux RND transporter periplasmic adaptor subunit n=1 Tax=Thiothrix lacustris TaxID=525917 RepID=UPI0027E58654|nr:efflux RND transporter periplasmic adaptor subunit [Thiothrix lacustris]WMP18451.1 efflux RND transporter periplasmic adaptor subunit [Thiothrix lacustris]